MFKKASQQQKAGTPRKRRKVIIVVAIAIVVVAAAAAAMLAWRAQHSPQVGDSPQTPFETATEEANRLDNQNDYTAQADVYRQYITDNPYAEDVPAAQLKLAAASLNAQDWDAAIDHYQQAMDADAEYRVAGLRGQAIALQQKGELQQAIDKRQEVINTIRAEDNAENDFLIDQDERMIQMMREQLEAQGNE